MATKDKQTEQTEQPKTRKSWKLPPVLVEYRKDDTEPWRESKIVPSDGEAHSAIRALIEQEVGEGRLDQGDYRIVRVYRRFRVQTFASVRAADIE